MSRGVAERISALIASKHQGMLDVIAPFAFLDDNCFIMKKELMPLPFFGWFAWKTRMIAVDRSAHAKALKDMTRQARDRLSEGRQIVIFPEGTFRRAPGLLPFKLGAFVTAAEAGATAVIQPGGSMRDDEVIAAANANPDVVSAVIVAGTTRASSSMPMVSPPAAP